MVVGQSGSSTSTKSLSSCDVTDESDVEISPIVLQCRQPRFHFYNQQEVIDSLVDQSHTGNHSGIEHNTHRVAMPVTRDDSCSHQNMYENRVTHSAIHVLNSEPTNSLADRLASNNVSDCDSSNSCSRQPNLHSLEDKIGKKVKAKDYGNNHLLVNSSKHDFHMPPHAETYEATLESINVQSNNLAKEQYRKKIDSATENIASAEKRRAAFASRTASLYNSNFHSCDANTKLQQHPLQLSNDTPCQSDDIHKEQRLRQKPRSCELAHQTSQSWKGKCWGCELRSLHR